MLICPHGGMSSPCFFLPLQYRTDPFQLMPYLVAAGLFGMAVSIPLIFPIGIYLSVLTASKVKIL